MYKYNYSDIGERIRIERTHLGSQEKILEILKDKDKPRFGRNTLSKLENGDKKAFNAIKVSQLAALCEEFGCSISYLMGEYTCRNYDIKFIHDYTGLSNKSIEVLHKFTTYPIGKERLTIIDHFLYSIRFTHTLTDKIRAFYNKYLSYKNITKKYNEERKKIDKLTDGDIVKEAMLLNSEPDLQTISPGTLKTQEYSMEASRLKVKKEFDIILNEFAENRYEKTPDTN